MPSNCNNEIIFLGLKLYELLTLIGIFLGPLIAVGITLWTESRRQKREGQIQVMRMLLNTRHLVGDPMYSVAINLVPVEFNSSKNVVQAWKEYIDSARYKPSDENVQQHAQLLLAKQTTLIFRVMQSLGFQLSESDIQTNRYASNALIERDALYLDSLRAMREIANSLKSSYQD